MLGRFAVTQAKTLVDGCYLLAYDVRDSRRLRVVHRYVANVCVYLQHSVYLYQGSGTALLDLVGKVTAELDSSADDLCICPLDQLCDLWFLCQGPPPIAGFSSRAGTPFCSEDDGCVLGREAWEV